MRIFIILLALFSSSIAWAQDKPKKLTCRILFLDRPKSAPFTAYLFDGKNTQQVNLPGLNLSPVYELAPGTVNLTILQQPPTDPKILPPEAPSVKIAETMTDIYLIVLSDPANKLFPLRLQVIDASSENLKQGETLWYNLTNLRIGGKLGNTKLHVQPKGRFIMDKPRNEAGMYPVNIAYRKDDDNKSYPICETRWVHDPRSRNLGFIVPKKGVRTPYIIQIRDFRPSDKKNQVDVGLVDN